MQAYTGFAMVYDIFMDNVPYEEWASYLVRRLKEHGIDDGLIAELGCGTGNITRLLRDSGYDMIGIDNSYEMLDIAKNKEYEDLSGDEDFFNDEESFHEEDLLDIEDLSEEESEQSSLILYLEQDMREFELYGTVRGVVSVCDSMNYITEKEDLLKVFRLVNNYLDKDGIFIFDMNTEYKYRHLLGSRVIAENREDCSFIWENDYNEETNINEYQMTIYVKDEETTPLFERFEEVHYQRAYGIKEVEELLCEAGMEVLGVYDVSTHNAPNEESERVYFIAKETTQKNKKYTV